MTDRAYKKIDGENEISLLDILIFLKGAWKLIGVSILIGLVVASVYLLITPAQYEAVATITIPKVPAPNNIVGVNIEEPATLIARMSLPGALSNEVIGTCGFVESPGDATLVAKSIKFSIAKGLSSVVELKVTRPTPEFAKACASSIVQFIVNSQEQFLSSLADFSEAGNRAKLATIETRLSQDKELLVKAGQPHGPLTPVYFAVLSDIRHLEDEQVKLTALLVTTQKKVLQLQGPIEVLDHPVSPKKVKSLAAGAFGGLFLGIFIALVRQIIARLKSKAGGAL